VDREGVAASPPLKVAIASVGDPEALDTWSGVTAGVMRGLRELGVSTPALDLSLPGALEQALLAVAAVPTHNRYDAEGAALTARARAVLAGRRLRTAGVDGVIQIGTTFALPAGTVYVTLEDMTLRQANRTHPVFNRMSARAVESWERRREGIYARARRCTAASHWTGESLRTDYGLERANVAVVGFGANHLATAPDRDWSSPRFLFVGIDWARKGGPQVVKAFSRVRQAHPTAVLDVVGGHPALSEPGVNARGVLSQTRADDRKLVVDLFARATCFVMPSLVEPFGIAHVEAASAGVPSIGSSVGGPGDVIGMEGGVVVDPGDADALLAAMLRLTDPDTARRMGEAALARSRLYTWPKVAERLLRALGLPSPGGRELAEFL
jgi:glycosyltransferase involved in cell wall biosynthesis